VAQPRPNSKSSSLPKFPYEAFSPSLAFVYSLTLPKISQNYTTMAPAPTTKSNKAPTRGGKSGPSKSVGPSKGGAGSSKIRKGSTSSSAKKPQGQVSGEQKKSKSANSHGQANKKKKKVYTAEQLGIPELNGIRPEGVTKPPNMKKGKNFVDDNEGMAAIMAMVMAEKDGNIESKMLKARHLEELREAKKAEAEKRAQSKKETFEGRMESIKNDESRKKKRGGAKDAEDAPESRKSMKNGHFKGFGNDAPPLDKKPSRKRVSFG
jgi:60S ribosomal subunit assembly/export protein LOC1